MNAGQRELAWMKAALPRHVEESCEENWMSYLENGIASDKKLFSDWNSFVPGSLSPCHLIVAAIQCMRNKGYDVTEAEKYIDAGLKAEAEQDGAAIQVISAKIYQLLNTAPKDPASTYWNYRDYNTWEELEASCAFPQAKPVDVFSDDFAEKIKAGWLSQLIGGAMGTQVEGYLTENIRKVFGEVREYLRAPETYNDDITYEIAFLDAFRKEGYGITSDHIADKWLELISDGYSAEEVALHNLRCGIRPPESGRFLNYYSDWIGAQMRTAIHGMVAPGNAKLAAKLAALDSVVSHSNNGLIGGIFNAVLVSLAFVEQDMKEVVKQTISCLPKDSEYYAMACFALECCETSATWEAAWQKCEDKFIAEYNWIHAYPNMAAEVVALWFGNNDFDETAYIITMCGQDADCTAGPVLNVLGVAYGMAQISEKWLKPLGEEVLTMMRKYRRFTMEELIGWTVESVRDAVKEMQ